MISYRDMAFCSKYLKQECINHSCPRSLNDKERKRAIAWWGNENFPISIGDFHSESCGFINNLEK